MLSRQLNSPTLILVTHHIEEIVPAFSHVLVLKSGEILAHGEKETVLTEAIIDEAFGISSKITKKEGRYFIHINITKDTGNKSGPWRDHEAI